MILWFFMRFLCILFSRKLRDDDPWTSESSAVNNHARSLRMVQNDTRRCRSKRIMVSFGAPLPEVTDLLGHWSGTTNSPKTFLLSVRSGTRPRAATSESATWAQSHSNTQKIRLHACTQRHVVHSGRQLFWHVSADQIFLGTRVQPP